MYAWRSAQPHIMHGATRGCDQADFRLSHMSSSAGRSMGRVRLDLMLAVRITVNPSPASVNTESSCTPRAGQTPAKVPQDGQEPRLQFFTSSCDELIHPIQRCRNCYNLDPGHTGYHASTTRRQVSKCGDILPWRATSAHQRPRFWHQE